MILGEIYGLAVERKEKKHIVQLTIQIPKNKEGQRTNKKISIYKRKEISNAR